MKYKDTLELYEELVAAGIPEEQAKIQAKQLGETGNVLYQFSAEIRDMRISLESKILKLDKDMIWMRVMGVALSLAYLGSIKWG